MDGASWAITSSRTALIFPLLFIHCRQLTYEFLDALTSQEYIMNS